MSRGLHRRGYRRPVELTAPYRQRRIFNWRIALSGYYVCPFIPKKKSSRGFIDGALREEVAQREVQLFEVGERNKRKILKRRREISKSSREFSAKHYCGLLYHTFRQRIGQEKTSSLRRKSNLAECFHHAALFLFPLNFTFAAAPQPRIPSTTKKPPPFIPISNTNPGPRCCPTEVSAVFHLFFFGQKKTDRYFPIGVFSNSGDTP